MSDAWLGRLPRSKGFIVALLAVIVANVVVILAFTGDSDRPVIERIEVDAQPSSTVGEASTSLSSTSQPTLPTTVVDNETVEDSLDSVVDNTEPTVTATPRTTQPPVTQPRTTRPPTTKKPTTTSTTVASASTTQATIPDVTFPDPTVLPDPSGSASVVTEPAGPTVAPTEVGPTEGS